MLAGYIDTVDDHCGVRLDDQDTHRATKTSDQHRSIGFSSRCCWAWHLWTDSPSRFLFIRGASHRQRGILPTAFAGLSRVLPLVHRLLCSPGQRGMCPEWKHLRLSQLRGAGPAVRRPGLNHWWCALPPVPPRQRRSRVSCHEPAAHCWYHDRTWAKRAGRVLLFHRVQVRASLSVSGFEDECSVARMIIPLCFALIRQDAERIS